MSGTEEKTRADGAGNEAGEDLPAPAPDSGTPPKPKRKGCRRFLWGILAGLLLGLAGLAGGVWYLSRMVG